MKRGGLRGRAVTLFVAGLMATGGVTDVHATTPPFDPAVAARLSAALERAVADSGVPGAQAAVILADGSTWATGTGVSAPGQPMTPDLLMAIASVTKLYTAALTLDLASDGLVSLDDPLDRWVPEASHAEGVTIRQLLSHTSGIASDDPTLDPVCDPGTCYSYSNGGYRYLGQVIERASGRPFADVLRQRILTPLGLVATFYPRQESTVGELATGYAAEGEMLATDAATNAEGPGWYGASGGLVATAADTARFAQALFTGALLAPSALGTMLDFDRTRGLPGTDDCKGAGMNVWRHSSDLGESWYAGGNAGSFRSWVEHYPAQGVTIAAITNSDVPATGIVDALAHEAVAAAPPTALGRCNTDIAVRSADGTVRLVTTDPGFDGFPTWSPDGSRLVWSGLRDGQQDLFVADVDGSDSLHLTDDEARDFFPRWSPDGSSIAFTSDRDGRSRPLPDGTRRQRPPPADHRRGDGMAAGMVAGWHAGRLRQRPRRAAGPRDGRRREPRPGGDIGPRRGDVARLVTGWTADRLRVGWCHLHRIRGGWRSRPAAGPAGARHHASRVGARGRHRFQL